MKKKKLILLCLVTVSAFAMAAGCGKKDNDKAEATEAATEVATEIAIEADVVEQPPTEVPIPEAPAPTELDEYALDPLAAEQSLSDNAPEGSVSQDTANTEVWTEDEGEAGAAADTSSSTDTASTDSTGTTSSSDVTSMADTKMYATEKVRMRKGPSTNDEIAGNLAGGAEVTVNGKVSDWYRITKNGETLYVKAEYLTQTKPQDTNAAATDAAATTTTKTTASSNAAATTDAQAAAAQQAAALQASGQQQAAAAQTTDAAQQQAASQTQTTEQQQAAAAQAQATEQQQQAAAQTQAAPAASAGGSYNLNGLQVNAAEYNDLMNTWRYATDGSDAQTLEMVLHHSAADLQAVLQAHGLR